MDNRPIGVFDSGLGGLTAVKHFKKILPDEKLVYFGDTKRAPYGDKTTEEIRKCSFEDIDFLLKKGVKAILLACGTSTSSLKEEDFDKVPVPIAGVVYPAAKAAAEKTQNNKIGIMATAASIRLEGYKKNIQKKLPGAQIFSISCPKLVPIIERERDDRWSSDINEALIEYTAPLKDAGVDTVILGCTHYSLIEDEISRLLPGVLLINAGAQGAKFIAKVLKDNDMLCSQRGSESVFYISGKTESFAENAKLFLGENVTNVRKAIF